MKSKEVPEQPPARLLDFRRQYPRHREFFKNLGPPEPASAPLAWPSPSPTSATDAAESTPVDEKPGAPKT